MAVPTFVGSAGVDSSSSGSTSTFTINLPTTAAGRLHVVVVSDNSVRQPNQPTGWVKEAVEIASGNGTGIVTILSKYDTDGSLGATLNLNMGNTYWHAYALAMTFDGVDPALTLADVYARVGGISSGTAVTCPDVTALASDTLVVRAALTWGADTFTPPGSPASTEIATYYDTSSQDRCVVRTEDAGVAAGSVGTFSYTSSNSATRRGAFTLALKPDAAAAPEVDTLSVTGTSQIGSTLTVNATPDQVGATPAYQWEIADDGSGTNAADLSGETASTLALTYTDFASRLDASGSGFVRVGVTYTNGNGTGAETLSAWQEVTVAAGSGGGGSPLTPPCIL